MKRRQRFSFWWLVPGLLMVLLGPVSGCFTGLASLGRISGGGPSGPEKVVLGTLDVVTFPVQAVIFGPLIVTGYIHDHTGERGRLLREQEQYQKQLASYKSLLERDVSALCANPDFQCPTNRAAMEAVHRWASAYNLWRAENVRPYAARVLKNPDLLRCQGEIFCYPKFSLEERRQAFEAVLQLYRTDGDEASLKLISNFLGQRDTLDFTEFQVETLLVGENTSRDGLRRIVGRVLDDRERERIRQQERQERERRERVARAERNRQAEELRRTRHEARLQQLRARQAKMQRMVHLLETDGAEFADVLAACRSKELANRLARRLYAKGPLPVENLRRLAEEVLKPEGASVCYTQALMWRREFSPEDLRRYYGLLLTRLRAGLDADEQREQREVAALVSNPRTPDDIVQLSYHEPLLVRLRWTYLVHRLVGTVVPDDAFRELERKRKEWENNPKLTPAKRNQLLEKAIRRYMPKDCPSDWRQSV